MITVTGVVPHDEIPARIAAARVLCAPSLVEPFGQAILEGLATGRPVVATRIGGPAEFVPPAGGVLVDPGDEDDIVDGPAPGAASFRARTTPPVRQRPSTT